MANGANNTGQRLRKIVVSHQPRGEAEERPLLLKQVGRGAGGGQKVLTNFTGIRASAPANLAKIFQFPTKKPTVIE